MHSERLPCYEELPFRSSDPPASSWGLWGDEDRCGTLNLVSTAQVLRAAQFVREGIVVPLDLSLDFFDPPLFGRAVLERSIQAIGPDGAAFDETVERWNLQSSSQWDGFGHVSEPGIGCYGGGGRERHGIDAWASRGVVARGVLADVAASRAARGVEIDPMERAEITPDELLSTIEDAGVKVENGDVLLVRTGWLERYRRLSHAERSKLAAGPGESLGLAAGEEMASLLWDLHVAAVAGDNPSLEAWPPRTGEGVHRSLHRSMLVRLGIPIGELFNLDELARSCAELRRYEFLFVSAPLHLAGAVASPANSIAVL